jgi:hypothetical protein
MISLTSSFGADLLHFVIRFGKRLQSAQFPQPSSNAWLISRAI